MSDDEKELEEGEGTLNPDLLEEGLGDDVVADDELDPGDDDGDVPMSKLIEEEDEEGLLADGFDDEDKW